MSQKWRVLFQKEDKFVFQFLGFQCGVKAGLWARFWQRKVKFNAANEQQLLQGAMDKYFWKCKGRPVSSLSNWSRRASPCI